MKTLTRFLNENGERIASAFLAIFSAMSLLIMVGLVGVGVLKMGMSIPKFVDIHSRLLDAVTADTEILTSNLSQTGHGESAVSDALEGLECIFLAPLAFLLIRGIWDFVDAVVRSQSKGSSPDSASPIFLIKVKALIVGLMIAVVATDLLKRALTEQGLTFEPTLAGCAFIAVLAAYAHLMEKPGSHQKSEA